MFAAFGWTVLGLVFLDELAAMAALAVWGAHVQGAPLALLAAAAGVAVWFMFASPRATMGGPVIRPVAKVVVFGLASAGLWTIGAHGWALTLLGFSVVVNAIALHPRIHALAEAAGLASD